LCSGFYLSQQPSNHSFLSQSDAITFDAPFLLLFIYSILESSIASSLDFASISSKNAQFSSVVGEEGLHFVSI
jgi:hypothetical protein